jgi:hypothetical protein
LQVRSPEIGTPEVGAEQDCPREVGPGQRLGGQFQQQGARRSV